jgi:hypothetical protein
MAEIRRRLVVTRQTPKVYHITNNIYLNKISKENDVIEEYMPGTQIVKL